MDGRIQRRPGRRGLSAFQTLTPTSPPPERYLLLSTEKPAQRVVALFAEIHWLRLVAGKYHRACATRTFRTLDCNWRNVGVIRLGFRHDPSPSKPVIGNQPFPALRVDNCSPPYKTTGHFCALNRSSLILKGKPHKATLPAGRLKFQHINRVWNQFPIRHRERASLRFPQ